MASGSEGFKAINDKKAGSGKSSEAKKRAERRKKTG